MTTLEQQVKRPAEQAKARGRTGSGWYAWSARAGLVAKGVSYVIVGGLAVKLAAGHGGAATSRQGALHALAGESFGKVVLILLAIGFAAYALWRFVEALAVSDEGVKKWGRRAASIGRGIVYAALAFSAVKLLVGASSTSGSQTAHAQKTSATLLSWPAGTWLVGIAGAIVIGVGLWNFYRGLSGTFEDKWRTGEMGAGARKWGRRVGTVGHVALAVVFGLIGVFVVKAALDYDPKEAIGLDGALQKLASAAYGPYLLGLTAAGMILYGVYCFFDARYRDVSAT
jgi:hypothetical protein